MDHQKGVPGESPKRLSTLSLMDWSWKRRSRWISKKAIHSMPTLTDWMDPQKGDPIYSSGWILKKVIQVDLQKGIPAGSPKRRSTLSLMDWSWKRRSRWISKKAIHSMPTLTDWMDPQKGDPIYCSGWILKKVIQVDLQKGVPNGSPKKAIHSIPHGLILKKAIQVDLQKGNPLYAYPYWLNGSPKS